MSTDKEIQTLNENFFYNSMLARALLQIIPVKERQAIRFWIQKLAQLDNTPEELNLRHEYMWFILLMLQTKTIRPPFTFPPPNSLAPLREAVSLKNYEDVLLSNDQAAYCWDEECEEDHPDVKYEKKTSSPSKFLSNQPIPKDGVICYLAAFSDQDI